MSNIDITGCKVMIVDDEEGVCKILRKVLVKEGYQVQTALRGRKALDLMKKDPVHVMLLDIKMPEMDGIEVLDKIRKISPDTVVIILTAYGTLETAREALRLGAYDYITKPFDNDFVKSMVKEAVQESTKKKG